MGVGKYTPNDAINGDMGWRPPSVKQWTCIFRHWARCSVMTNDRINYKVFKWSHKNAVNNKKNWCNRVMKKLKGCNFDLYTSIDSVLHKNIVLQLENVLFNKYIAEWQTKILSQGNGNKLRTYKLYKSQYCTELYLKQNMSIKFKSAYAKFRCGVAPLKIETGRYENKPINERSCFMCKNEIEDEKHVFTLCPLYADLRNILYSEAVKHNDQFYNLSNDEKFIFLFRNEELCQVVAKTCFNILCRRTNFLFVYS